MESCSFRRIHCGQRGIMEHIIEAKNICMDFELGDGSNIEEQLIDLDRMLEPLKGKKGTLDLKNFDTAVGTASFKIQDSSAATTENTSENEGNATEPEQTTPSAENITEATTENTVENTQQTPDTEVQN